MILYLKRHHAKDYESHSFCRGAEGISTGSRKAVLIWVRKVQMSDIATRPSLLTKLSVLDSRISHKYNQKLNYSTLECDCHTS